MKPTLSIIVFTVSSGAGLGLLMLVILLYGLDPGQTTGFTTQIVAGVVALVLIIIGLVASTFHLANPRNAWKSFSRFRTSWLSREAVFAVLLLPLSVIHLGIAGSGIDIEPSGALLVAIAVLLLALATLISTSMIYASLKPIRQWHNPVVPPMYLLLGLASGGVLLTTIEAFAGERSGATGLVTLAFLIAAALSKLVYYRWIGQPGGPDINTATGITRAQVRLQDIGHSHGTFLTREFGNRIRWLPSGVARSLVLLLGFLLPAVLVVVLMLGAAAGYGVLAMMASLAGMLLERWLFFVEARHTVNLYHGAAHT